jgi:hypothetical protein
MIIRENKITSKVIKIFLFGIYLLYLFISLKCGLKNRYDELFIYWALVTCYLLSTIKLLGLNDIYFSYFCI